VLSQVSLKSVISVINCNICNINKINGPYEIDVYSVTPIPSPLIHNDKVDKGPEFGLGLGLWSLTPLSTIQLYRGGQFYWWRKPLTYRK